MSFPEHKVQVRTTFRGLFNGLSFGRAFQHAQ
jgi:hypothetical protein